MSELIKARIPQGFLELLPQHQKAFNAMLDKIRINYERFGFVPIETPAIEYSEVLLAKGGGETDRQIYRFQRGDSDYALHFDLTVPLARYVAEHYNDLTFPFRRYQIQKVWRAERPQKGRFREFYQCDIDVVGTSNPLVDAEIPSVIYTTFRALGFSDFTIRISNRKILSGLARHLGLQDRVGNVLRVIDKLDRMGREYVVNELHEIGVEPNQTHLLVDFVTRHGSPKEVLLFLREQSVNDAEYQKGVDELELVVNAMLSFGVPKSNFRVDLGIARGLDYYTGTVYETTLDEYPQIGSVCSGGRYDDLTKFYTNHDLPAVGISIGLTRLFSQMMELGLVQTQDSPLCALIVHADPKYLPICLEVATALRHNNVSAEVYFDADPIRKQLKYANKIGVPHVLIVDGDEISTHVSNRGGRMVTVKNMSTGDQKRMPLLAAISSIGGCLH